MLSLRSVQATDFNFKPFELDTFKNMTRTPLQYRVWLSKSGVRVIMRDDETAFTILDNGKVIDYDSTDPSLIVYPWFVKYLTEWTDING